MKHSLELTELEEMALKKMVTGQINQLEWFLRRDNNGVNQKAYRAQIDILNNILKKL